MQTPRRSGRPRSERAEEAILAATIRLLAEVGYARMSVDAIVAEARTTKPTLYRRWSGKEELAIAALSRLQRTNAPELTGDARVDLVELLRDFRAKLLRPNGMAMIGTVLAEEHHVPELIAQFRERIVRPRREGLRAVLESARAAGRISAGAPIDAAVAMLIGSFYALYLSGEPIPAEWPERAVDAIWPGLVIP